jgi:hypothetical protein
VVFALFWGYVATQAKASPIIYGSAYSGSGGPATLYTINPNTGAATPVGAIGFKQVSALDFDPSNGRLYGVATDANGNPLLLTINTATGAGTEVGSLGAFRDLSQDIAFRPSDSTLFSYNVGKIFTIDPTTGNATFVGDDPNGFPDGNGLAFSSSGTLYTADQTDLRIIDQTTGNITHLVNLNYPLGSSRANGMKFDFSTDTLYASVVAGNRSGTNNYFATIDIGSGIVTEIGPTVSGLDAIAIENVAVPTPEPTTLTLLATGFLAIGGFGLNRWRRRLARSNPAC